MPGLSFLGAAVLLVGAVEARRLELSSYAPAVGERIELKLGGAPAAEWAGPEVQWMFVRVAQTQRNYDASEVDAEGRLWTSPGLAGVGVIGVDLRERVEELDQRGLRAFVAERGRAAGEAPRGEGVLKVERVESFKAVFRAGPAGAEAGASEATSKTGQRVEIRPLMDPTAVPPGSDLALRAYVNGSGASGARVVATHAGSGAVREVKCDSSGIGHFTVHAGGLWRVEMHELRSEEGGKWVLYSGMLTFATPAAEEGP